MRSFSHQPKFKSQATNSKTHNSRLVRLTFIILGAIFFITGVVGVVLPVLPTTPFMLLAAGCWAKGSDTFHQWLLNHKRFGKIVINWQQHRAIPRRAKYLAWSMMALSCGMLFYRFSNNLQWLAWLTSAVCVATAIWMSRLPDG